MNMWKRIVIIKVDRIGFHSVHEIATKCDVRIRTQSRLNGCALSGEGNRIAMQMPRGSTGTYANIQSKDQITLYHRMQLSDPADSGMRNVMYVSACQGDAICINGYCSTCACYLRILKNDIATSPHIKRSLFNVFIRASPRPMHVDHAILQRYKTHTAQAHR